MFVQQIIILSHKTYKLAHESQTRQNDYPNFVQILAAGVFKLGDSSVLKSHCESQYDVESEMEGKGGSPILGFK